MSRTALSQATQQFATVAAALRAVNANTSRKMDSGLLGLPTLLFILAQRNRSTRRKVWDACIQRLDVECAPNLNPFESITSKSAPDLKRTVISAIQRHRNWADPRQHHNLHVTDLPITRPAGELDILVEPRLLPGGRDILILNCGRLELWSLVTKEKLWEIKSPVGRFSCAGFDYDVVDDGNMLNVAILFEDFETSTTSPLRLYSFDLRDRQETILFERMLPPVFLFRMMLRNEFFIACIPRTLQTVVINWKTGEALTLGFIDSMGNRIEPRSTVLANNELVSFATLDESGFSAIRLPISVLAGRWSKEMEHAFWTRVSICPGKDGSSVLPLPYPRLEDRIVNRNDGFGPWILAHRVFTPVWKPNPPTEIFIAAYDCGPGGQTPTRLVSFRLQLSHFHSPDPNSPPIGILSLVKSSCAQSSQLPWNSRSLSNSGRMFSLRSKIRCFSLFADTPQPMNELNLSKDIVPCADDIEPVISCVEPWSGAIAVGRPGRVKIVNFI
ncbi:hypothetical protein ACEPAF_4345 [Sanghuangporus sanghuang]